MKRGALLAVASLVAVLLIVAIIPFFVNANTFLPILEQRLSATLGRKVTLGNLSLNLFEGGLTAKDLTIADDPAFSTQPFLKASQLRVGVNLQKLLFHRQLDVTRLEVIQPEIQLLQSTSDGHWNYASLGASTRPSQPHASSQPPIFSVDSLKIENGQAQAGTVPEVSAPRIYSKINLTVTHFSFSSAFPFQLSADLPSNGTVKLTGTAGPIPPGDSSLTPFQAELNFQQIDLVAAGFLDKQAGISGTLGGTVKLSSDGTTMSSSGEVTGTRMQFSAQGSPSPTPIKVDYNTSYQIASVSGTLSHATLTAGQIAADLTGTFRLLPAHPQVNLHLDCHSLSIDALQSMLPAVGVKLPNGSILKGGALSTSLAIDGPINNLVIAGPIAITNTQLAGYSLGSKLSAISALNSLGGGTGNVTDIQTLQANLNDTPQVITVSNILAVVPSLGQATGSGTILPGGQLNFNMLAKLSNKGGLGAIATGVMAVLPGMFGNRVQTDGIPLTVRGTTSNPSFNIDAGVFTSSPAGSSGQKQKPNTLGNALQGLFGTH